jgi:hypothetical protein
MLFQPCKAVGKKALPPKADHLTAGVQTRGDLVVGQTFGRIEDHLGSLDVKIR